MKKFIIFLILAMVFAVSCSGSKKTENDTDLLPDEDEISGEDADEPDEDAVEPDDEDEDK